MIIYRAELAGEGYDRDFPDFRPLQVEVLFQE